MSRNRRQLFPQIPKAFWCDLITRHSWAPQKLDVNVVLRVAARATVDPEGFLIGELDGAPAVTISCVNYQLQKIPQLT